MDQLEIFPDGDNYKILDLGHKASAASCLDDDNTWDGNAFERRGSGFNNIGDRLPKHMLQFHRDNSEYMTLDGVVTAGAIGGNKDENAKWCVYNTGFTLGIWFKLDSTSGIHYLYSEQGTSDREFNIWIDNGTPKFQLGTEYSDDDTAQILTSDTDITDTNMHFLLVSYDHQSPYTHTMYLDNTSVATENQQIKFSNVTTNSGIDYNHPYIANKYENWSTNGLVGSIATVIGWAELLTSDERDSAYNSGTVPNYIALRGLPSVDIPYYELYLAMGNYANPGSWAGWNAGGESAPYYDNYYTHLLEQYEGDSEDHNENRGHIANRVIDLAGASGPYTPADYGGVTWRRDGRLSDARIQDEDNITTTDGINLVDIP